MKKSTSFALAVLLTAGIAAPATAAITHELSAPDASVRWVPAPGVGPTKGTITEEDKLRPGAHSDTAWYKGGIKYDDRAWWQLPREDGRRDSAPRYDSGKGFTSDSHYEHHLPADATYQWWVDGAPATEPANLPVKPFTELNRSSDQDLQLVYTYTLGGQEVTETTATQNSRKQ